MKLHCEPASSNRPIPAQTTPIKPVYCVIPGLPLVAALITTLLFGASCTRTTSPGPVKVEVRQVDGAWQLYRGGKPYYIKGAGLEFGDIASLAAQGGNSFRTWRTENGRVSGQEVLDRAHQHGLTVAMGLEVARERHGFDYNDPAAVGRQLAEVKAEVLKYKDHPALLVWIIGNELNLNSTNPKVWDAVNQISKMIHAVDPNHPTMTALAGIGPELVREIQQRAPDLDLIGIQMYADIINLPRRLRDSGWTGPYIVTEWGATGHWEVPKTAWGAPLENDSTTKAEFYHKRYETVIRTDQTQCLGSYVFLWEQKQERTPTWYGVFLESGEKTAAVDVMHYIWKGAWPANRSPRIESITLDSRTAEQNIKLQPDNNYPAVFKVHDEDNDPLTYSWVLLEESKATSTGGDHEERPRALPNRITNPHARQITLRTPTAPGAYRLFAYAFDGQGHAAHANIPFYVERAAVGNSAPSGNP